MKENKFRLPLYWKIRKFFGADVVALLDYDGEVVIRAAKTNAFGERITDRYDYIRGTEIKLNPDGSTSGLNFVEKWTQL